MKPIKFIGLGSMGYEGRSIEAAIKTLLKSLYSSGDFSHVTFKGRAKLINILNDIHEGQGRKKYSDINSNLSRRGDP